MRRRTLLTGRARKHSGSSGQLVACGSRKGGPEGIFARLRKEKGETAGHSSHRSVHGADAEVPGE